MPNRQDTHGAKEHRRVRLQSTMLSQNCQPKPGGKIQLKEFSEKLMVDKWYTRGQGNV